MRQDKPTLFLGEAKVSAERSNPPSVVDKNNDSLYNTHIQHATDNVYLLRKLCNYAKKLKNKDAAYMYLIIYNIEESEIENYDVVYGCCMVRDNQCVSVDSDFGKLMTNKTEFEPNSVYFYIPSFECETIEEVVEKLSSEVLKIIE